MRALVYVGLVIAFGGCGGDAPSNVANGPDSLPTVHLSEDHAAITARDRRVLLINVSKRNDRLVYRIHEDAASEQDVWRLAANMASYSPDVPVLLVPGPTLTPDEVGWLRARLREQGLSNVRVVSSEAL